MNAFGVVFLQLTNGLRIGNIPNPCSGTLLSHRYEKFRKLVKNKQHFNYNIAIKLHIFYVTIYGRISLRICWYHIIVSYKTIRPIAYFVNSFKENKNVLQNRLLNIITLKYCQLRQVIFYFNC